MRTTRQQRNRGPPSPPPRRPPPEIGTSATGGNSPPVLEQVNQAVQDLPDGAQLHPQANLDRVVEDIQLPSDDKEDGEARDLKALNQMQDELLEKRCRVKACQKQARLQVIRQKADQTREKLR
jgi:gluconate kinase